MSRSVLKAVLIISLALIPFTTAQSSSLSPTTTPEPPSTSEKAKGGIGSPCEGDADCSAIEGEVECKREDVGQTCQCKKGSTGEKGGKKCLKIVDEEGGACEVNEQCTNSDGLGPLSRCQDGKCECYDSEGRNVRYDSSKKRCELTSSSASVAGPTMIILAGYLASKIFNV